MTKDELLARLRGGEPMSGGEQFKLTLLLAWPSIMAQLAMCLMSYIDAAMVGRLGSEQAAAIGLVSSTTWIFGSFCYATSSGFSVQIAHRCGAKDFVGAKRIFRHGVLASLGISVLLMLLAVSIHRALPHWLGGTPEILADASAYFLIYALFLPLLQLAVFCEATLIASGNAKVPGILSVAMCGLDVVFNYVFIFLLGMGVKGAALGTGLATAAAGAYLLWYAVRRSRELRQDEYVRPTAPERRQVSRQAFGISWPLWIQNLISRGAYIAATVLSLYPKSV